MTHDSLTKETPEIFNFQPIETSVINKDNLSKFQFGSSILQWFEDLSWNYIWVKVFNNGPSKIYERQPLKKIWSDVVWLCRPYHFKFCKGCLPQILYGPFLNNLSHMFTLYFVNMFIIPVNLLTSNVPLHIETSQLICESIDWFLYDGEHWPFANGLILLHFRLSKIGHVSGVKEICSHESEDK